MVLCPVPPPRTSTWRPDRLEVSSPGGLFGNILPDELLNRPASSSRNAALAKLLEDVSYPGTNKTVCENRGSKSPSATTYGRWNKPAKWYQQSQRRTAETTPDGSQGDLIVLRSLVDAFWSLSESSHGQSP